MNTHTILNVKTDKKLKAEAQKISKELGVPLSTVVNAFLKKFVREKEITLSINTHSPTPYLEELLEDAQAEHAAGEALAFDSGKDLITHLKSL